jgi:asparagine synthase (glutamine-hydrolysing)
MCGIAGYFESKAERGLNECQRIALAMASSLAHRGPDDEGSWADARAGVALGHRRLAILDLSEEGHQPMHSEDGRYVLVFNGEIYNFRQLRRELEHKGYSFRGHSDTEVMLAAFCAWGFLPALDRFVGMFALALWDHRASRLHLARDRIGEKPLYYGWAGNALVFGSELKALRAYPEWRAGVDRHALALLLRYGYIPAPYCIYENTYKLQPGYALTLTLAQIRARKTIAPARYWSAEAVAESGAACPFEGNEEEARQHLLSLLRQSVAQQMVADVPVGAFLSGGIDSSLVVALMQEQSRRPIKSFSIGFDDESFNEAHFAKAVACHLGTDHTELYVQPSDLQQVIPRLPCIYDEPFADSSQIPTAVLCQLARQHVKVSLSGDGGDELFAGYGRYRITQHLWRITGWLPEPIRKLARHLDSVSRAALNRGVTPEPARHILTRLWNLSNLLARSTDRSVYQLSILPNPDPRLWLKDGQELKIQDHEFATWERLPELLQRMICQDLLVYLPDDILVKVDRAAMSVALETRIPLLDHRIIEFACSLPSSFKQRQGQGKWILREMLYDYVPRALVDRPKRGFGAPIGEWLRGSLRGWAEGLLDEARLRQEGFFEPGQVRQNWEEHLLRRRDWPSDLWPVLMFQAWLEGQKSALRPMAATKAGASMKTPEVEVCQ